MTIETNNATYASTTRQIMITATAAGGFLITRNVIATPIGSDGEPLPVPGLPQEISETLSELPPALAAAWAWDSAEPEQQRDTRLRSVLERSLTDRNDDDSITKEDTR